jgi:membrane-associated phospholipid phosphatase
MVRSRFFIVALAAVASTLVFPVTAQDITLQWSVPGVPSDVHIVTAAALDENLLTLDISGIEPGTRPAVQLACENRETLEQGTVMLTPLAATATDAGMALQFDLANAWASLPYPPDPWGMQSKPLAIIGQRNEIAPSRMAPAQLRAEFAWVRGYMLETAAHQYRLPLGNGHLRCVFRLDEAQSAALDVQFGRGLLDGPYPRDLSTPDMGRWQTWVIDDEFTSELPPRPLAGSAALRGELDTLLELQSRRSYHEMNLIRRWDDGSAVGPWIDIAMSSVLESHINPPRAARAYALVSVAMYDALGALSRDDALQDYVEPCALEPALLPVGTVCGTGASPLEHAVVAGAASTVFADLFPNRAAEFAAWAQEAAEARLWAGASLPVDAEAGLALGRQVGALVLARAHADRSDSVFTGTIPTGPSLWVPDLPSFAGPQEPMVGQWQPWNLTRPDQFRPGPPPEVGSPEFAADLEEVYAVGQNLSIEQEEIASDWEDKLGTYTPSGHWNAIALHLVRENGFSTARTALLFATLNTAQADAFIAAWDAKYTYWSMRPITAVHRLIDPDWLPYIYTPPFPSYISGHATTSAASAEVLSGFFPERRDQLHGWAEQAALSRLYGGIHFRTDNEVALRVGHEVGTAALDRISLIRFGGL